MIEWCNNNQGFISAILTILTLFLSGLAIYVSIRTARLPYKKKLKLNENYKYFMAQTVLGSVHDAGSALNISATNLGNRLINLIYLGVAYLENKKLIPLLILNASSKYKHEIDSCEISNIDIGAQQLVGLEKDLKGHILYAFAQDSEGQKYKKEIGTYEEVLTKLKITA